MFAQNRAGMQPANIDCAAARNSRKPHIQRDATETKRESQSVFDK